MKKAVIIFVVSALALGGLAAWLLTSRSAGKPGEIIMAGIVLLVVAFALFLGFSRLRSRQKREPAEDEMSKSIMTKASSLAYYVSIYLWLFVMYISDKTTLETQSLIGGGIMGMAVAFVLCWLGVKAFGMRHE